MLPSYRDKDDIVNTNQRNHCVSQKIVAMLSSYTGLQNRRDWLWKQTPHPFGVWDNIQMLGNAPNPDFLLLYQSVSYTHLRAHET